MLLMMSVEHTFNIMRYLHVYGERQRATTVVLQVQGKGEAFQRAWGVGRC